MKMRLCDVGSWGVCVTPWRRLCGGDVSVEISEAFWSLDEEAIETGNASMEYWSAWINDPEAMMAAELDKLRKGA